MRSDPPDEASHYDHSHHHGTISFDGTVSPGGYGSEIANLDGAWPIPAFGPAPDAIAMAEAATTAGANKMAANTGELRHPNVAASMLSSLTTTPPDGGISNPLTSSPTLYSEIASSDGAWPIPTFGPPPDPIATTTATTSAGANEALGDIDGLSQATEISVLSGLTIIPDYDSSISNLLVSSPTLYSEITGAITAAIDFLEAEFTNPLLITIDFGYGEMQGQPIAGGELGASNANYYNNTSYGSIVSALSSHATSAAAISAVNTLKSSSPVAGATWDVSFAEMKALGLPAPDGLPALTPSSTEVDGWVGISSSFPLTYNPADRAVSGDYDAIGVFEHEITEDMGRVESLGTYISIGNVGGYTPLDLFRYSSPGVPDLTPGPGYFSFDGGQGGATNQDTFNNPTGGGDAGDWASNVADDSFDAISNSGVANTVSATDLTVMNVLGYSVAPPCFAAGTRIQCAGGEVRVEDLAVGDLVFSRSAGLVQVKWVGQRRIDCRRHPAPERVWPVRIMAGAFGPDLPRRDLWLSPDHAVAVGGTLIPVKLLVNGASIRQVTETRRVHYFHVELDRHDILFAHGLPVESYLDTGNRHMFANAAAPLMLHPWLDDGAAQGAAQSRRETLSCLPFRSEPTEVHPVWLALAARSEDLGLPLPAFAVTDDPELCIVSKTRRFAPITRNGALYTFVVPAHADGMRLRSRFAIPSSSRPWLGDTRRLGVAVRRISVRCGMSRFDVAPDDPCLTDGWWDVEGDASTMWRWTNGDAALPCANGPATIEVLIGSTLPYQKDDPMPSRKSAAS